jgi:hypothetical protein
MLSALLVFSWVQGQEEVVYPPSLEREFERLGRQRADFGDVSNSGKWKYVDTHQFGGTYIFFPVGRADIRYYLVLIPGVPGPGSVEARFNRQSKEGDSISLEWMFELTGRRSDQQRRVATGTLGTLLEEWDLPANAPEAALRALDERGGLAAYRVSGGHGAPFYWFITADGTERKVHHDWSLLPTAEGPLAVPTRLFRGVQEGDRPPRTKEPYPISAEEKRAIAIMRK